MKRFFPKNLCEFRNSFIACYLISVGMIGFYAYKSYENFFAEKKLMMELASYKIASDLVNIFDHAEKSLNEINKQIAAVYNKDFTKNKLSESIIEVGKIYKERLIKYELSTGKFYWIDEKNRLIANSDIGTIDNPIDLSDRDYLQNSVENPRRISVGAPIVGASSGQYVIPMGVGAEDHHGHYLGTMAVSFKLMDLALRYSEISHMYNVNFALLSADNKIIFESKEGVFTHDKKLFDDLSLHEVSVAEEFVAPFSLDKRQNSYVVVRASDKYQYKILIGYENKILYKELATKMACCLLQILIVTIFFLVAIFYMRKDCQL